MFPTGLQWAQRDPDHEEAEVLPAQHKRLSKLISTTDHFQRQLSPTLQRELSSASAFITFCKPLLIQHLKKKVMVCLLTHTHTHTHTHTRTYTHTRTHTHTHTHTYTHAHIHMHTHTHIHTHTYTHTHTHTHTYTHVHTHTQDI